MKKLVFVLSAVLFSVAASAEVKQTQDCAAIVTTPVASNGQPLATTTAVGPNTPAPVTTHR